MQRSAIGRQVAEKAGGIAGRKVGVGGFIENCYAYGAVSATKGGVGGILGQIDKSCDIAIKNSAAWSNLTGVDASSTVGRIVGVSASLGSYENCYTCESIVLKVNEKRLPHQTNHQPREQLFTEWRSQRKNWGISS